MLRLIWNTSNILILISIIFMIVLIIKRMFDNRGESKRIALKKRIRGLILDCYDDFKLIDTYKKELVKYPDILMSVAKSILPSLTGETKTNMIFVLEKLGVLNLFIKNFKSLKEENRSLAIRNIAIFGYEKNQIMLYKTLIQDTSPNVRLDAAVAINDCGKIDDLIFIIYKVFEKGNPSSIYFKNFLRKISPKYIKELISISKSKNILLAMYATDALGYCGNYDVLSRLIEILETKDIDNSIKASALDALANLQHPACEKSVVKCLDSDDEEIKIKSAICAGKIQFDSAIPKLDNLLKEGSFKVRYNAAVALSKLGDIGGNLLKSKIDTNLLNDSLDENSIIALAISGNGD